LDAGAEVRCEVDGLTISTPPSRQISLFFVRWKNGQSPIEGSPVAKFGGSEEPKISGGTGAPFKLGRAGRRVASDLVKCSFCGKSEMQVHNVIKGPGVCICNECVEICNDIIREEGLDEPGGWSSYLQAAQQGNEPAWRQVCRLENPALLRYLTHYQRVDAMAEEVWQRAKQQLGSLVGNENEEAFQAWLFTIAREVLAYE
jgi:hypothetical protein